MSQNVSKALHWSDVLITIFNDASRILLQILNYTLAATIFSLLVEKRERPAGPIDV